MRIPHSTLTARLVLVALVFTLLGGVASMAIAQAPAPTASERIEALKESLARSTASLKQYEWIETTVVSLKGEEKSRTQNRCYYGADGKKQEVPVMPPPPKKKKFGIRGAIAEHKKEELTDYMKQAVALVKSYVPPDPARLQAAKSAGKISVQLAEPGQPVKVEIKDYLKPGDAMKVHMNMVNNTLLGIKINSYLQDQKDVVSLDLKYGTLNDGTSYVETVTLEAPSQNLGVARTNSGYIKQ